MLVQINKVSKIAIDSREELLEAYQSFFTNYQTDDNEFKYIDQINRMIRDGQRSLNIEYEDLVLVDDTHDLDLASTVIEKPYFALETGSEALGNHVKIENEDFFREVTLEKDQFFVRFVNTPSKIQIRDIRANHVDSLKWLNGLITRTTEIRSIITEAIYSCNEQDHENRLNFIDGIFVKPIRCIIDTCKAKDFILDHRLSKLIDWQMITLQEKPEDLPPGASPKSISCRLMDDTVNAVRPGDRVQLGGIVRIKPTKQIKKGQILTYETWIDVNYIESLTKEDEFTIITPDEEKYFLELAQDPKIHEHILNSIAPAIFGMKEIKEAAVAMLFGGVDKKFPDGFSTRGQPNVLMVGDPGTAKSQLLKYVQSLAPRGLYTSGKGSSAAGLTAAIIRDPDTGEITLEAGALVLADRGICLIDEFDKMNENDRSAIHESMEQHSYHPNTEIRFADGSYQKIGKFVDTLFENYSERFIQGINCEILPIEDLNIVIKTTDFDNLTNICINRVSRHAAPDYYFQIKYSNGREISVTPEHPIYVYDNGITTVDASELKIGDYIPAPRELIYEGEIALNANFNGGHKKVYLPKSLNLQLAKFLGYYVAEGYSNDGNSAEVGLSNSDPLIIKDMKNSIKNSFNIDPLDYTSKNRAIRIVSRTLYDYLHSNFPNLMQKSYKKRIPYHIFRSNIELRATFLSAAFDGDGSVETEACAYSTNSIGLAHDYQDLLLSLNIHTRIHKDIYNNNNNKSWRYRYKVYISGDSLKLFSSTIIPHYSHNKKLQSILERSRRTNRRRDVLPGQVGTLIRECLNELAIPYDSYLYQHIEHNYGLNIEIVKKYILDIQQRITVIRDEMQSVNEISPLRKNIGFSQYNIAEMICVTRGNVDYNERGGYSSIKRNEIHTLIQKSTEDLLFEVEEKLEYLKKLLSFRWLRVKRIQRIENVSKERVEWVYDITVEPTRNFISQGVILHNTVSIAKAGIVATLNSRTGVFAAANPKYGRYEARRTFSENVNLTPAILSRFDLVFVIRDVPDEKQDSILAEHILKLHRFHGIIQSTKPPFNEELLKKYIAYAKSHYNPILTEEAAVLIEDFYVAMRTATTKEENGKSKNRIAITARQLEGIVRLSEARARGALRNQVTKIDAQNAIDLMKFSLSQIAIDPDTGLGDIDAFYSGQTVTKRTKLTKLLSIIDFLYRDTGGKFSEDLLYDEAEKEGLGSEYAKGVVQQMRRDGSLYQPGPGWLDKP